MRPELFSPFREPAEQLRARHVGRARELDALTGAAQVFAGGGSPLPLYLFGPPGSGKSHLFALARAALGEHAVTLVADDSPAQRSARDLLARWLAPPLEREPRWHAWKATPVLPEHAERRIVLVDGLDRQLRALGLDERRELRRLLDRPSPLWIAGSGTTLADELTGRDEAFFGAFDPWPLEPLAEAEARALLVALGSLAPAQERALLALAGGQPRLLVALAAAAEPDAPAGRTLARALSALDGHHAARLRELSPQAQQMVELLAAAAGELSPTELAEALGASSSHMSVQAGRLESDGVLTRRTHGRQAFYRLAEPAQRLWLEAGGQRWEESRAAWIAELDEASAAWPAPGWWEPPPRRGPARRWHELAAGAPDAVEKKARALEVEPRARELAWRLLQSGRGIDAALSAHLAAGGLAEMAVIGALEAALRADPADAEGAILCALGELGASLDGWSAACLAAALAPLAERRPSARVAQALAALPFVRARLWGQGPRPGDRPWLEAPAIEGELPDADHLLVAACLAGDDPRLHALAGRLSRLPPCPRPLWRAERVTAEALAAAFEGLLRGRARARCSGAAAGWCAMLEALDNARFEALVSKLAPPEEPPGRAEELALMALAHRTPARAAALAGALGESWARPSAFVAEQLGASESALHPELARMRALLG